MINIRKKSEPDSLTHHRCQANAGYHNLTTQAKEDLRTSLLEEQGFLCCYCMCRIRENEMRIEHWHSQTSFTDEQLAYGNLLAACVGNEGNIPKKQHCDVRKGDREIQFNPANPAHDVAGIIKYLGDGTIRSIDQQFDKQIDEVLNLNFSRLKDNRKAVTKAVQDSLQRLGRSANTGFLNRLIRRWASVDENQSLKPYCGVAIYYLEKKRKHLH